jgi:hypothetical protein
MKKMSEEIICKATGWFKWRAVLMIGMFLGFAAYFYYDGKVGYRNQNANFYNFAAKSQVKQFFDQARVEKGNAEKGNTNALQSPAASKQTWQKFVAEYEVTLHKKKNVHNPETRITDVEGCFPEGYTFPKKIPQPFVDRYDEIVADIGAINKIWRDYTVEQNIEEDCGEYFRTLSVIHEQYYWAAGSCALGIIGIFFLVRTLGRSMTVSEKGYTPPGGTLIPFETISKIDRRKWKRKGLACIYYDDQGVTKKARVDGMVYGQFDETDPNNAEVLFAKIQNSVSGAEIIDYEDEENADEGNLNKNAESESSSSAENKPE